MKGGTGTRLCHTSGGAGPEDFPSTVGKLTGVQPGDRGWIHQI